MCISGLIDHSTVIKRLLLKLSHLFCFYFVLDISIAAVDLMQELTDVDTLNESEEGASALIGALVRINFTIYQIYNPTFYANFSKSTLNLLEQIQTSTFYLKLPWDNLNLEYKNNIYLLYACFLYSTPKSKSLVFISRYC